jgi:hypothetical protein
MGLVLLTCLAAKADTQIFDLAPTNNITTRSANDGTGQGVIVSTTTTIDNFAFFLDTPNGGDVKFMIFDGTNSTLLYSQTEAVAASGTPTWVETNPLSFTLDAGSTYYFGVISDNDLDVGYIFPTSPYSANGLTAVDGANANYVDFSNPAAASDGLADIGLELFAPNAATTPEPGSLALLGTGIVGIAGAFRRRWISN